MPFKQKVCEHLESLQPLPEKGEVCEACVATGGHWVHLRTCVSCGATLCCDSSPNQHARGHFESHGHPIILSAEPGENWAYCYQDELFIKDAGEIA
ncbi:MAG: UBP-type zinc finger domain-containing protein [Salibacteraceae bacterium]